MKPLTPERKAILAHLLVDPGYNVYLDSIATEMTDAGVDRNDLALVHRGLVIVTHARVPKTIRISDLMRDERLILFVQYATKSELARIS